MSSAMALTPATSWKRGQPASVNLNVGNDGATTFTGTYGLGLFRLDGSVAQTIALKTESSGLQAGFQYNAPYLTFSTAAVTVEPGTYLLALQHNPNNMGWKLTGSSYFQNPVKVIVEEAPLAPDAYETNNTLQQAGLLTVAFNNTTTVSTATTGSNLHIGSDYDYFKLNLPEGYEYFIRPRLHDANSSANGNTYTVDALFSYSTNGVDWSEVYDDVMAKDIELAGGASLYFHVAPYFSGETGTYLLDISVRRKIIVGVEEIAAQLKNSVEVYPNPASQAVTIDISQLNATLHQVVMTTAQGQEMMSVQPAERSAFIEIPVLHMRDGIYLLQLKTDKGPVTKKLIVKK
jgi:hypothetical protein